MSLKMNVQRRPSPNPLDRNNYTFKSFGYVVAALFTVLPLTAAADAGLRIELNKLEQVDEACRAYLLFENGTENAFRSLKLDLVMFGQDGVITKRLAVEGGPLAKGKTSVKLFEISGLSCDSIARVLLNDVIDCQDVNGDIDDCVGAIATSSKNEVDFFK